MTGPGQDEHGADEKPVYPAGVPFDGVFFGRTFPDRVKAACPSPSTHIPVVVLDLADGRTLDLCHIDLLAPQWMAVSAFRETASCEEMDVVFVPYEMIALVTVSARPTSVRRMGFQLAPSSPLLPRDVKREEEKGTRSCRTRAET